MSACQRKISRLPISVFQDLITRPPLEGRDDDPESVKTMICDRLSRFRIRNVGRKKNKNNHGSGLGTSLPTTTACSIKTVGQLLRQSKYTLMLALDPVLTYEEVEIFFERACIQCAPKPSPVLQLLRSTGTDTSSNTYNPMRQIPTSLPSLDRILRGGVRLATVTEFVGRSGVGKTQLAFQFCITAAKFNQGAIYIDTEKKLSLERLKEMSEQRRLQETSRQEGAIGTFKTGDAVLDNLTVHQPGNSEELLGLLDELEYEVLIRNQSAGRATTKLGSSEGTMHTADSRIAQEKYPVRLLIVDSIAAPIRRDFGTGSAPQRAAIIFQCAQKLKRLADQLHMAIVVINQAGSVETGIVGGTSNHSNYAGTNSGLEYQHAPVRAALGTSWHHCVSTRLLIETEAFDVSVPKRQRIDNDNDSDSRFRRTDQTAPRIIRKIAVTKSNITGYGETHFNITAMGVVEV